MALLQPRLSLKIAQRQILTPGLMQMVSVLALNKLELKEMIDAEMVENPVLEEIDESVPMLDEVSGREERAERDDRIELDTPPATEAPAEAKDPFEEVDFGSYFQEYLDPGYKTQPEFEENERPSFENFLSQPTTLSDHLAWQLGSLSLGADLEFAAEFVIGNLDGDGYLSASDEELAEALLAPQNGNTPEPNPEASANALTLIRRAIALVQTLDPVGIAAHDLRECLELQIKAQQKEFSQLYAKRAAHPVAVHPGQTQAEDEDDVEDSPHRGMRVAVEAQLDAKRASMELASIIVTNHLALLQKRDLRDLSKAIGISTELAQQALEFIRTLDPRPGRQYNREQTRLIEPDVVFLKNGGEWIVSMNEEDLPSLRLSSRYRRMLAAENTDREVKEYVKERFRSALQLMRNIAQRKSTILKTCEVIVRRQRDFLEHGIESLRPMMIKEVAEEIGVHPSTVSRAVANKYAHTPQGVLELRSFFTESSNGPEGADTPLVVLKRKVRKLIEDESPQKPLTDDQLAAMLQTQGIQITRRTVAKYREDMNIPSTHQRRKRD